MTTPAPSGIVDSHIHWWNPANEWMLMATQDEANALRMGDISPMLARPYLPSDYRADIGAHDVQKVVWVMATGSRAGHLDEIRWVLEIAKDEPLLAAIIGSVDPDLPRRQQSAILAEQAASPLFRGVRVIGELDYSSPSSDDYMRMLAEGGWVYDHMGHQETMHAAAALADRHPDVPWILEHCGWPLEPRDADYVASWKAGISALAAVATISCKLSGLAMALHTFDIEAQRPFLEYCLDAFGVDRCLFGSNFPPDRLYGTYDEAVGMFEAFIHGFSDSEKSQLLRTNAEHVYRI